MGRPVIYNVGYRGMTNAGFKYTLTERLQKGRVIVNFDPPYEGSVEAAARKEKKHGKE